MTLPFENPIKLYTEVTSGGKRVQVYLGEAYQNASGYFASTDAGILPAESIEEAIVLVAKLINLEGRGLKQPTTHTCVPACKVGLGHYTGSVVQEIDDHPPAVVVKDTEVVHCSPCTCFDVEVSKEDEEGGIMSLNEVVGILIFGKDLKQVIKDNKCMTCDCFVYPDKFRDKTSKHEYTVSGMCQHCQDSVFVQ